MLRLQTVSISRPRGERDAELALAIASLSLLTLACTPSPPPPANAGEALPSCGRERNVHGEGYDAAARDCLWKAYQTTSPAELVITHYTVEGDPITFTIRMRAPSNIEVTEDSKDNWGWKGIRTTTCTSLEKIEHDPGRYKFKLGGCQDPRKEITIP